MAAGKSEKLFMENEDGVHLMNPIAPEYSYCGDAFDVDPSGSGDGVADRMLDWMQNTKKKTVTCSKCIEVIRNCRGVHTANVKGE